MIAKGICAAAVTARSGIYGAHHPSEASILGR